MKRAYLFGLILLISGCGTQKVNYLNTNEHANHLEKEDFAIPLFTMPPRYPKKAAIEGIEGYVRLLFDIESDGSVSNIRVVKSEPDELFVKEAVRAVYKWKFRPEIQDGIAVKQFNKTYIIDFSLR